MTQPLRGAADAEGMTPTLELSAPHNWCDRRCERCPLAASCPIPAGSDRPLEEILADAVTELERLCLDAGIDVDNLEPPPPLPIDARVLEDAGRSWALAFADLEVAVDDVPWRVVLVGGKVARIACEHSGEEDDLWTSDVVPNLLLLEHVLEGVRLDVDRARPRIRPDLLSRFDEQDAILRGLLAPLFTAIPPRDRAIIAALAAAGRAPSPLATR